MCMCKIIISKEQYKRLTGLQNERPISKAERLQKTTAENIMSAKYLLEDMEERLQDLSYAISEFEAAIYDHELDGMINRMTEYVRLIRALEADTKEAGDYLAGSVTRFMETTALSAFTVIRSEAEIKLKIDQSFENTNVMSIGYKDGEYALLFGEDEETVNEEPFIFAKGGEECYDEARKFIETFLDLEE